MSKLPLVHGVRKFIDEKNIYLCMPGHKNGKGFFNIDEGEKLGNQLIEGDITEVDGVDNLHDPKGIIKESQELLSKVYGSTKGYFLVNGSTSGNLAMIFSSFEEGDQIIVERNCHRSILNAIIMRKLKPIYVQNLLNDDFEAPLCIDEELFINVIKNNTHAKGIIITYPNYYGVCVDLKLIIEEAKKYDMKVLVDSAHGAHFGFNHRLPKSAVELGAHMVVMSAHKTLPSLTQTAYLHINEEVDTSKVDFFVSAFLSTSPSYMLMQSMDYARFYLQEYGNDQYNKLLDICEEYREKINKLHGFYILGEESIYNETFNRYLDKTRYVINVKRGYSGHKLNDYLRRNGIQAEMSDNRNVILIFSPFNTREEFEKLYCVLRDCNLEEIKEEHIKIKDMHIPEMRLLPYEAFDTQKSEIELKNAVGRICGEALVPYPPGVPLVMPGEIIDNESIGYIEYCLKNGMSVLGINDNKIKVIDLR